MLKTTLAVIAVLITTYAIRVWLSRPDPDAPHPNAQMVPVVGADDVLSLIRNGKRVVFVDAREGAEWEEEHIPGAVNISLREIRDLDAGTLGDPDLVIAYCLKDFRGFEVAKALQHSGVRQASILKELGINGWKKRGLPTVLAGKLSEEQGRAKLLACASGANECGGHTP